MKSRTCAKEPRKGCKDIWNANMAKGAKFCTYDIPFCKTTATDVPTDIITCEEAKVIYRRHIAKNDFDFKIDAFVCFYIDDYKFDGAKGVWNDYKNTLKILRHFAGAVTPDFSTYQDFPIPVKLYATYKMRLLGHWPGINGVKIINNVRWRASETWCYCFEGIPQNSIVAIGTVGGNPHKLIDRERFESGLFRMVEVLKPRFVVVYGSANYKCFEKLRKQGINIVSFKSKTAKIYEEMKNDE